LLKFEKGLKKIIETQMIKMNKKNASQKNLMQRIEILTKKVFLTALLLFAFIGFCSIAFSSFDSKNSETLFSELQENKKVELILFYSVTCPHCEKEIEFLKEIEGNYPDVRFLKYSVEDPKNIEFRDNLCKIHEIRECIYVPLTIIRSAGKEKGDYLIGFATKETTGKRIIEIIENHLRNETSINNQTTIPPIQTTIPPIQTTIPFIKDVNEYSLPILSVILGFIDGFNVCSLGALVIILGLVIGLKSRRLVLAMGGTYILVTAIVYGLLMFFWYGVFETLGKYIGTLEIFVGIIGIFGGIYFLKEFWRFKKYGPTCEMGYGNKLLKRFSEKFSEMQKTGAKVILLILSILVFSIIITVVEFPCSAVVPLFYTGILATKNLPFWYEFFLMVIYLFFYMLDEIAIFLIAFFTLKIKLTSGKATTWIYFFAGIIFIIWGASYLLKFIIHF
jgi:thiol-disulfide isomerase/thioredoxin